MPCSLCWGESSPCPPHTRHSPYEAGANKKNAASYEASKPLHPQRNRTQISSSGNRWQFSIPLLVVELSIYHSVFMPRHSWCLSNSTGDLATRLFVQNHIQNPEEIPWVLPVSSSGSRITWEVGSGGRNQRSSKRGQRSSIWTLLEMQFLHPSRTFKIRNSGVKQSSFHYHKPCRACCSLELENHKHKSLLTCFPIALDPSIDAKPLFQFPSCLTKKWFLHLTSWW